MAYYTVWFSKTSDNTDIAVRDVHYKLYYCLYRSFYGKGTNGFFFLFFFLWKDKFRAQLLKSVRKEHVGLGPDAC